ncbi:glycosyltransferase [Actinacidiphila glaucinigra]|uniref:glycosyltransferase n=1 Tax=Actinacidiphila glaucinigra TaxID=235986 RepID=UPI0037C52986
MTASVPVPATRSETLTGKRRVAFASYVDENYLPGFLTLLRSLALTNPTVCEDFVVLYDDLQPASITEIRKLHPRIVMRRVVPERYDDFVKGDPENYLVRKAYFILDVFRIRDYDTVITLDTDMVVLGDLAELLRMRDGVGAVPQFLLDQSKLNSGLLVIQKEYLTDEFCARIDAVGTAGTYELDKHDQGILNALLAGTFIKIDPRYNFVKRRLSGDRSPGEEDVAILHFTGRHKPWNGGEHGYSGAEAAWQEYDLPHADFVERFLALPDEKHPDLLIHFGRHLVASEGRHDAVREVAEAYLAKGRYEDAVEILGRSPIPADESRSHELLGQALMATSRYEEATAHLLLSTAHAPAAARPFGRLANMAWVLGDNAASREYALAGLNADVSDRACRISYERAEAIAARPAEAGGPSEQLAHVAFYMERQGNAGDKILPETVRLCFGPDTGDRSWHSIHAHKLFDEAALERVNSRRGLVIGGGGLFIPDTSPNGNSAWQWNVPDRLLEKIDVPLAVFAVGYNAFDGQSYTRRRFEESLRLLVSKSAFFGLRNHGSVEKVRALLPAELQDRVLFQPCPTTVSRQLVPGWQDPVKRDDTVLINCAYDRAGLRFGHDYDHFLREMATAVRAIGKHAEVRYAAHALDDERFVFDLRREYGISMPVEPMYDFDTDQLRTAFARTKLVIGMRGHAGMIPFGCGTPIISLISHPKMAYFLSDIERPEWGVSVHDRNLGAILAERSIGILDNLSATVADVHGRQEALWKVTQDNVAKLKTVLG